MIIKQTAKAGLAGLLVLGMALITMPDRLEAGHKCGGHCKGGGFLKHGKCGGHCKDGGFLKHGKCGGHCKGGGFLKHGKCCSPWKLGHKHKHKGGCQDGSCGCGSIADYYSEGAVYGGMGNNAGGGCRSCQSGSAVAGPYGMGAGGVVSPQIARPAPMKFTILHYPGTKGTAYERPTRVMPADGPEGHPRDAGLDIYAPGATDIRVVALNRQRDEMVGYRDPANDDIWEFVTKRPLIPGIQHIYQVYAMYPETGNVPQTKRVRLIMGRIVELSYKK